MKECTLNQMPLNQAFFKRLLLFRHQTWEDLISLLFFSVRVLYLCNLFYFFKKIIA